MNNKILLMGIFSFLTTCFSCSDTENFKSVEVDEFATIIEDPSVMLVDVRTPDEYSEGHIENAININATQVEFNQIALNKLSKNKTIAVYCRSGRRSKKAANELSKLGFRVVELDKGFKAWTSSNKSIVTSPEQNNRESNE